jgi:hypothetical protein
MRTTRLILGVTILFGLAGGLAAEDKSAGVTVKDSPKQVDFYAGKQLVTSYHLGPDVAKPFFYPVNSPGGLPVTRSVPAGKDEKKDHVHQKSAWFCHGDVIPEGIKLKYRIPHVKGVDFWSEAPGHGKIVCVSHTVLDKLKFGAGIDSKNEWRTADGVKILDEDRRVTLREVEGGWLLVFDIDLHASVCPITFGDTKEGSFGVRIRESITETGGKGHLTNAEGKEKEKAIWGQRSSWCDYSGPVPLADGKSEVGGLAIFDDPKNPPAAWHSRGYGLMAANPFGRASFPGTKNIKELVQLKKGEHLKLRYGLFLHAGNVTEGKVGQAYTDFVKGSGAAIQRK